MQFSVRMGVVLSWNSLYMVVGVFFNIAKYRFLKNRVALRMIDVLTPLTTFQCLPYWNCTSLLKRWSKTLSGLL